ncbi:MAG: prenyltransferase [Deltaproteobacteria bacterium]|nr:prenyltransferase [Deltaproteobacteria bacterium]
MNLSMWKSALLIIPRVEKETFSSLDVISKWLIITRAAVLIMTLISAAIGGVLAARDNMFDWLYFFVCTIGLIFAHATNNLINDLTDSLKGVDKDNYFRTQYGPHPLEQGLMSKREFMLYLGITASIALLCGVLLLYLRGGLTIYFLLAGVFFVLFYTYPLKYIGLGEIAVLLVWGPLLTGGTYYVVSGNFSNNVMIASIPYAIGTTTVLFGKHIDKYEMDKSKGIRTLPVLLGESVSRKVVISLMILELVFVIYLVLNGYFSVIMLSVLFSFNILRQAIRAYLRPRPEERPEICPPNVWPLWFVAIAFYFNRRFGLLFLGGLVVDTILIKLGIKTDIYSLANYLF